MGFTPTLDTNEDGKPDYYFHTDGKLYRVADAGQAKAGEAKAYYNGDGSLDRIVVNEFLGEGFDSAIKGFASSLYTIYEVAAGTLFGLSDIIKNVVDGDNWTFDLLEDWYVGSESFKQSEGFGGYLFGNNVYTTSSGFLNSDGSVDFDGIFRGTFYAVGMIGGMLATAGVGKTLAGIKTGAQLAKEAAAQSGKAVAALTFAQKAKDVGINALKITGNVMSFATGFSQGAPVIPALGKTTMAATLQGLTFLAARDFTTSVASLTARKEQLGIDNAQIITNSAAMAAVNFGVSYLLRSTLDKSALLRHAEAAQVKIERALALGKTASL